MGKTVILFICLLALQVTSGLEPSIEIKMVSHPAIQYGFHALHIPKYTKVSNKPSHLSKLDPTQLGLLFSHLLGLNPSENLFWGGVTSSNPLFRPRALSLITFEGLSERTISLPEGTTSYMVQKDISAVDWLSGAFNPSILRSRIVEVMGGQNEPLMVSVSGQERTATAGPKGIKMMKRYFNPKTNGLSVISDYQHTEMSTQQVIEAIHTMDIDTTMTVSKDTDSILVRKPDGKEVLFNLKVSADIKFFTELMVAMDTIERMQNRKEAFDNVPDLIAITFTALKDLRLKYGDSSAQVSAAIQLYSSLLPKLTNRIASLYDGQVAVFGLGLIWTNPKGHTIDQSVKDIFNIAREHLETQDLEHFQLNFPEILLKEDSKKSAIKINHICSLATALNPRTQIMQVSCPHRLRRDTFVFTNNNNNNTNNTIDEDSFATELSAEFPYVFNIVLLIVLVFIISLFAISWAMWHMDIGTDSIIYRTTEPAKLKLE